jgi:hypothetical protein
MREIRLSGSEGGGTLVLPTPIQEDSVLTHALKPWCPQSSRPNSLQRPHENWALYQRTTLVGP